MKNAITINFENNTAIVTKAFYKAATTFGTREYKMWMECRQQNPDISMMCKTISKNPDKKNDAKNKTYEKMATYIDKQENKEELMKEFELQKQLAKIQSNPYRAVLAWFLAKFPETKAAEKEKEDANKTTAAEGSNTEGTTAETSNETPATMKVAS